MENMNFFQIRPLRSVCPGWYIKRLPQLSVNKMGLPRVRSSDRRGGKSLPLYQDAL